MYEFNIFQSTSDPAKSAIKFLFTCQYRVVWVTPTIDSSMDLDTLRVSDFGSTPSVESRLQRALQVYKTVWDEFYIQEETYCEDILKGCERPTTNDPSTEIQDVVDDVPLEFHPRPRKDGKFLEDFTIEQFDTSGNSERYSTVYCFDTNKESERPYRYPTYECCTPASRNEIIVDHHCGALAFIPYADDEAFKIGEYISYFDLFAWQSDFPDPDWELIELEVMTRLVLDRNLRFTIPEVDELQILRKSRMSHSSGLLWDTSQRDVWHWTLPNADKLSKTSLQQGSDIALQIDNSFPQFCPKLYCLRFFCGGHGTLFQDWHGFNHPEPKKTSEELKKGDSRKQYCGRSCYRLIYSEDTPVETVLWENEDDITLVESVLKILPDTSPCDLAIICRKQCSEIYAFRCTKIRDETVTVTHPMPPLRHYDFVDEVVEGRYEIPPPCYHRGPCTEESCTCMKSNVHCQRSCQCSKDCLIRWKGCSCGGRKKKGKKTGEPLCSSEDQCECRRSGRECDPDVCIGCNARGKTKGKKCHNVELQRGKFPPLVITFGTYGLGAWTHSPLQEGTIIGEYVGEIMNLTATESPTCALIHDHTGFNYKYDVQHGITLDGAKLGNETRYLNDSKDKPEKNNCHGQIFLIDGDFRLALVASTKIPKSHELLLDYGDSYWKPAEI